MALNPLLLHRLTAQLPSRCHICHSWPAQPLCNDCLATFTHTNPRCQSCGLLLNPPTQEAKSMYCGQCGDCLTQPPPLDASHVGVDYAYPWADLIARFKFRGQTSLSKVLASLLLLQKPVQESLAKADCVLPIPLSTARLQERGFNQALLLAKELSRTTGVHKIQSHLLVHHASSLGRIPQHRLGRLARKENVKNSFELNPRWNPPLLHKTLGGKNVVLVDDVMTTGATLFEVARLVRLCAPASVEALVIARTPL